MKQALLFATKRFSRFSAEETLMPVVPHLEQVKEVYHWSGLISVKCYKAVREGRAFRAIRTIDNKTVPVTVFPTKAAVYSPANEAFKQLMAAKKAFIDTGDAIKLITGVLPALQLIKGDIGLSSLQDALEWTEAAISPYDGMAPTALLQEATEIEDTASILDTMESDDVDEIDVYQMRARLKKMGREHVVMGRKGELLHELAVLLKRAIESKPWNNEALEELVDRLSEITFDARVRSFGSHDFKQVPSHWARNIKESDRDEMDHPDLFPPAKERNDPFFDEEIWYDLNTLLWQAWIEDLDNWERVCVILSQGEESYTDSDQYNYWRKLVDDWQPWVRGMRNQKRGQRPSWTEEFANSCRELRFTLESEVKVMEAGFLPSKAGLATDLQSTWDKAAALAAKKSLAKGQSMPAKPYTANLLMWIAGMDKLSARYLYLLQEVKHRARR